MINNDCAADINLKKFITDFSIISLIITDLIESFKKGKKIMLCGNGGSASMCDHIASELMKNFVLQRSNKSFDFLFGSNTKLNPALPALSLCSNNALISAIANDIGYEYVFAQQILGYGNCGDIAIIISTSGNSKNCLLAASVAKTMGIKVIALTYKGSELEKMSDYSISFLEKDTAEQQELHLMVLHYICKEVEKIFFN